MTRSDYPNVTLISPSDRPTNRWKPLSVHAWQQCLQPFMVRTITEQRLSRDRRQKNGSGLIAASITEIGPGKFGHKPITDFTSTKLRLQLRHWRKGLALDFFLAFWLALTPNYQDFTSLKNNMSSGSGCCITVICATTNVWPCFASICSMRSNKPPHNSKANCQSHNRCLQWTAVEVSELISLQCRRLRNLLHTPVTVTARAIASSVKQLHRNSTC